MVERIEASTVDCVSHHLVSLTHVPDDEDAFYPLVVLPARRRDRRSSKPPQNIVHGSILFSTVRLAPGNPDPDWGTDVRGMRLLG